MMNLKWFKFFGVLLAATILFAVIVSGGCGGGNSDKPGGDQEIGNYTSKVNSARVVELLLAQSNVYSLADAFSSRDTLNLKKGDIVLDTDESEDEITRKYGSDEASTKAVRDHITDYILPMGAVLAFVDISAEDIDYVTDILSLELPHYLPDNATNEEKDAIVPFYAIALRILDGNNIDIGNPNYGVEMLDYFTYFGSDILSGDMIVWFTSGDEEISLDVSSITEDSEDVTLEVSGDVKMIGDVDDQAVNNFLDWVADMNDYGTLGEEGGDVGGSSMKAAAKDSGVEMSYAVSGQNISYNFDYYSSPRKYYFTKNLSIIGGPAWAWADVTHWRENGAWNRKTTAVYNIRPIHNFDDGADYYVISLSGQTNPAEQYAHITERKTFNSLWQDYILGYNRKFTIKAQFIVNPKLDKRYESGPLGQPYNVLVYDTIGTFLQGAPVALNSSRKVSEGFSFSIDGQLGVTAKEKANESGATIKPSFKYEKKTEYSVSDYVLLGDFSSRYAGWSWEFQLPANGGQGLGGVYLEDVAASGRSSVSFAGDFAMKVTKEEWKKYPTFYLLATFSSKEGATEGGGTYVGVGNVGRRDWTYDWSKDRYDAVVKRPVHIAVSRPNFNFKPTGTKGESQIMTLLSEEDWTAKASDSWIHLSTSDNNTQKDSNGLESVSGNATGSNLRQIMIDVDENYSSRSRVGKITFTASDGETSVIEISQAR